MLLGLGEEHTSLELETTVGMAYIEAPRQAIEVRGQGNTLLIGVGDRGVELGLLTTTGDAELIVLRGTTAQEYLTPVSVSRPRLSDRCSDGLLYLSLYFCWCGIEEVVGFGIA